MIPSAPGDEGRAHGESAVFNSSDRKSLPSGLVSTPVTAKDAVITTVKIVAAFRFICMQYASAQALS